MCTNLSWCGIYIYICMEVRVPGMGTKNVLKWNCALGFEFSFQSSVYGAESKPITYLDTVYCKFLLYVCVVKISVI